MQISEDTHSVSMTLWISLLLSFLIKATLMPITMHGDLIFVHYFPSLFSYYGVFDVYHHIVEHREALGFRGDVFYYPPATLMLISLFQFLIKPLAPELGTWLGRIYEDPMNLTLFTSPQNYRHLFLLKASNIPFDLGIFTILWRFCKDASQKKALCFLWLLNPVVIYASYMFGQFDLMVGFFCIAAFALAQHKKIVGAVILLAAGFLLKKIPLFLAPPLILLATPQFSKRIIYGAIFGLITLLLMLPYFCSSLAVTQSIFGGMSLQKMGLVEESANIGRQLKVLLFFALYAIMILKLFFYKKDALHFFLPITASIFLLMYALFSTATHYFLWGLPFFVLLAIQGSTLKTHHLWILMLCLLCYKIKRSNMSLGLFIPLDPEYFSQLPGIKDILQQYIPWKLILKGLRICFVVLSFYLSFRLLHPVFSRDQQS